MEHASRDVPEFRAGATDLSERRRSGVSRGAVLDIDPAAAPAGVSALAAGGLRIGALTTVATVAADTAIARDYPALAAAAGGLATPQIRRAAAPSPSAIAAGISATPTSPA